MSAEATALPPSLPVLSLSLHTPKPVKTAVLTLPRPGTILIARPLMELKSHICNYKLPSFELLARAIVVLVCGIFRGHLCDRILLKTGPDEFRHTIRHKGTPTADDHENLNKTYPYMLEHAYELILTTAPKPPNTPKHLYTDMPQFDSTFLRTPIFTDYQEISPQTICGYYCDFYGVLITEKFSDNTIADIFASSVLSLVVKA